MIFDENALGKTAVGMYPARVVADTTGTDVASTAVAIDTAGYESCVLNIAIAGEGSTIGNCTTSTGVPIAITVSNTSNSGYVAIDVNDVITTDGTYDATTKALTVLAGDITAGVLSARVSVVTKYRYVKVTISNIGQSSSPKYFTGCIIAELGRPRYSTDFLAYDVVPSQA